MVFTVHVSCTTSLQISWVYCGQNHKERVCECQPEGEGFVEDIQGPGPCSVFADDEGQKDLQGYHGHGQQGQLLLGDTGLHQLQARHCIGC